jgi:5-methylcytosine-specific restriction endonuclease McrA
MRDQQSPDQGAPLSAENASTDIGWEAFEEHFDRLTNDVKMDGSLFRSVILWALIEHRIDVLTPPKAGLEVMIQAPDGLKRYWDFVQSKTGRDWSLDHVRSYWDRVRKDNRAHARAPIRTEDRLRLFFTSPQVCHHCNRAPPDVRLHLDHREPVARGGGSGLGNLQYLCSEANLAKGARITREDFFERYLC